MAYLKDAILCGGSVIHDAVQAFLHSENYSGIGLDKKVVRVPESHCKVLKFFSFCIMSQMGGGQICPDLTL